MTLLVPYYSSLHYRFRSYYAPQDVYSQPRPFAIYMTLQTVSFAPPA